MKDINEEVSFVRAIKSRTSGYTGLSILYRLHKLYGFDIFKDLVYDCMHNLPTNVVSNQLKSFINSEKIDSKLVDQRLHSFPWTAGRLQAHSINNFHAPLQLCHLPVHVGVFICSLLVCEWV